MHRLIKICSRVLFIILLLVLLESYGANRLYVGNDDAGKIIAGIESSVSYKGLTLFVDIKTTQLEEEAQNLYNPNIVDFKLEISSGALGFIHKCHHGINEFAPIEISDEFYLKYTY